VLAGLERGWEGKGVGDLCVDGRLCWGDWLEGGRVVGNFVLTAVCVG